MPRTAHASFLCILNNPSQTEAALSLRHLGLLLASSGQISWQSPWLVWAYRPDKGLSTYRHTSSTWRHSMTAISVPSVELKALLLSRPFGLSHWASLFSAAYSQYSFFALPHDRNRSSHHRKKTKKHQARSRHPLHFRLHFHQCPRFHPHRRLRHCQSIRHRPHFRHHQL